MFYQLYRAAKRIPGIGALADMVLRTTRNIFWSLRPAPSTSLVVLPEDYIAFVESHILDDVFTLVEVGAGDGRVLRQLAARFPAAHFIGVDIQRAAVAEGSRHIAEYGIDNVELVCASCLEDTLSWSCDYLISRTALIYLNRREIELFLRKRLPEVRQALLLQEVVSLNTDTHASHFFAHPLGTLAEAAGQGAFTASTRLVDYGPWRRGNCWSGAEVIIRRIKAT